MKSYRNFNIYFFLITLSISTAQDSYPVNSKVIAQIREEGLQRSEITNTLSYMTDVIGARLTNSKAMYQAQDWVVSEMKKIGLKNIPRPMPTIPETKPKAPPIKIDNIVGIFL